MDTFFWLILATGLTVAGDYFIKLASDHDDGMTSTMFLVGAVCYGLPALAWFFLMQQHSLATIGVLYSSATLVLLALLGIVVFKEAASWRDAVGIGLALAAVLVMHSGDRGA
jgi:multidrug transporter EmrE-like cation transporter